MSKREDRFTSALTDEERALLSAGLTLLTAETCTGIFTGEPPDNKTASKRLPVLLALMSELGREWGFRFSPDVIAMVDQFQAAYREEEDEPETV